MNIVKNNLKYIVIAVGVVLVWRGIWGLLDQILFPSDPFLSYGLSIVAGIAVLLVVNIKDKDVSELL